MPDAEHWLGLTHFGPLTRGVLDAALPLDVLHGQAPGDADTPPSPEQAYVDAARTTPAQLRITVSTKPILPAKPGAAALDTIDSTTQLLRALGHQVREHDPDYGDLRPFIVPRYSHGACLDAQRLERHAELERRTRGMVRLGSVMGRLARRSRAKGGRARGADQHGLR